ncbi:hypothetical protein BN1183_AF_00050 [Pantoea ananatis]|nr:hypothetical protein BN1183_AF_00050 [Pantoea ananatis]
MLSAISQAFPEDDHPHSTRVYRPQTLCFAPFTTHIFCFSAITLPALITL